MENFDLISAVQPPTGWFALCGIKPGNKLRQIMLDTREAFDAKVEAWKDTHDLYYGVAKFRDGNTRTKDNVEALQAFWLDLDCGPTKVGAPGERPKGYIDHDAALAAFMVFCRDTNLPKPTIVNSGGGYHVYWTLTEPITRAQWEAVAAVLKQRCYSENLYADPAVFEAARILRIPGTYNFKAKTPRPVVVELVGNPVSLQEFCSRLGAPVPAAPVTTLFDGASSRKSKLGEVFADVDDHPPSAFRKVLAQCAQMQHCVEHASTLEEPLWRAALSIASRCTDRDVAIRAVSEGHPGYSPEAVEEKIRGTVGPLSCIKIAELAGNDRCSTCKWRGKTVSPITTGRTYDVLDDDDEEIADGDIPNIPYPYARISGGGIIRQGNKDEEPDYVVYDRDLYIVKRMRDPVLGDVFVLRLHTLFDGLREFMIPNSKMVDRAEVRKILAAEGVLQTDKQFGELLHYLMACINNWQKKKKVDEMRLQFGWVENNTRFILGGKEIGPTGILDSPPSNTTASMARDMKPKGSIEKWKEVFNLYNRPGLEPHAFGALTAFGAPLFKFLGQKGLVINLIHPRSGTGKTTILHMCNSVYGSPDGLCGVKEDTLNSKLLRLGAYCNLPYTIDEITNLSAADFSTLIYNMTQGRGKDRVKHNANELRDNFTTWQTMSLTSSNASFYERMGVAKASPDGELMRLMEFKIDYAGGLDPAYAKRMFDHQLMKNYGHAGPAYIKYLIDNFEESLDTLHALQAKIDREFGLGQRERFWSSGIASNLAGGVVARRAGLINYNIKNIFMWAGREVDRMRQDVVTSPIDELAILGDFINSHLQNLLVVDDKLDGRSAMPAFPKQEPKGELIMRYEPDTKRVYVVARAFKEFCVMRQANYADTVRALDARGLTLQHGPRRIGKGLRLAGPAVHCLVFDGRCEAFGALVAAVDSPEPLVSTVDAAG
jgi:hypothetical protein